jgi:hypothetical protein
VSLLLEFVEEERRLLPAVGGGCQGKGAGGGGSLLLEFVEEGRRLLPAVWGGRGWGEGRGGWGKGRLAATREKSRRPGA